MTIIDNDNTQTYVEGKVGFYFYDPNPYLINNRLYLSGSKVLTDNTSFYTAKLSLDWVFNNIPFIKPYVGLNGGYIYNMAGKNNYSSGSYGFQAGVLLYIGSYIELEIGGSTDKATQHTDIWQKNLKKIYAGLNISF